MNTTKHASEKKYIVARSRMSDEYKGALTSSEKSNGRKFVSSVVTVYGTRLLDKGARIFSRPRFAGLLHEITQRFAFQQEERRMKGEDCER